MDETGKGCVVVAASGNQGQSSVGYPANIEGVIAVGSIDRNGVHTSDANYGKNSGFCCAGSKCIDNNIKWGI